MHLIMTMKLICFFLLFVSILQCVVSDMFYIVTSPQSACPDNYTGNTCLTLNHFANYRVTSLNIILEMQPGNHSLDSGLSMEFINFFKMQASSSAIANIVCNNATGVATNMPWISLNAVSKVLIKRITFSQCGLMVFHQSITLDISDVSFSNCRDRISIDANQNVQMTAVSLNHCQSLLVTQTIEFTFQNSTIQDSRVSSIGGAAAILHLSYGTNATIIGSLFSSNFSSRALQIDLFPLAVVSNCTFYQNRDDFYGAALSSIDSSVIVSESIFSHNSVSCQGGAVYVYHGSLTVLNSTFLNNKVGRSFGYYCSGGAIYIENGSLTVSGSTFDHNRADRDDGGAICSYHGDSLIVTNCTFRFNEVSGRGGALCSTNLTVIEKSFFINNRAKFKEGGAVYVSDTESDTAFIRGCTFFNNTALNAGGGAIYSTTNIEISESTFTSNSAPYCGVLNVDRDNSVSISMSTFQSNQATSGIVGGGVACISDSHISVFNSSFRKNSAGLNGGVFLIEGSMAAITSSSFIQNHATERGGVFYISNNAVLEIHSANIFKNTANLGGVISACNSQVTIFSNIGLIKHIDIAQECILYDDEDTTTTAESIQTTTAGQGTTEAGPTSHSRLYVLPFVLAGLGGVVIVTSLIVVLVLILAVWLRKSMKTKAVSTTRKSEAQNYIRLSKQEVFS